MVTASSGISCHPSGDQPRLNSLKKSLPLSSARDISPFFSGLYRRTSERSIAPVWVRTGNFARISRTNRRTEVTVADTAWLLARVQTTALSGERVKPTERGLGFGSDRFKHGQRPHR